MATLKKLRKKVLKQQLRNMRDTSNPYAGIFDEANALVDKVLCGKDVKRGLFLEANTGHFFERIEYAGGVVLSTRDLVEYLEKIAVKTPIDSPELNFIYELIETFKTVSMGERFVVDLSESGES